MTFEKNEIERPSQKAFCKDISSKIQNLEFLNLYHKSFFSSFSTFLFPQKPFLPQPDFAFFLNLFFCCLLVWVFSTNTSEGLQALHFSLKYNYTAFFASLYLFWLPWCSRCLLLLMISPQTDCSLCGNIVNDSNLETFLMGLYQKEMQPLKKKLIVLVSIVTVCLFSLLF